MKGNSILSSPAILSDPRMRLAARQIYAFFKTNLFKVSPILSSNRKIKS